MALQGTANHCSDTAPQQAAGTTVWFHNKMDSLPYSSYILGFLVKEEFVSTSALATLILWGGWLSKLKKIWCLL